MVEFHGCFLTLMKIITFHRWKIKIIMFGNSCIAIYIVHLELTSTSFFGWQLPTQKVSDDQKNIGIKVCTSMNKNYFMSWEVKGTWSLLYTSCFRMPKFEANPIKSLLHQTVNFEASLQKWRSSMATLKVVDRSFWIDACSQFRTFFLLE